METNLNRFHLSGLYSYIFSYSETSPIRQKSLDSKAFLNPFRYKVSRLLPAKLHTQHGAFEETSPPVALSSIHSPTLDRI